MAIRQTEAMILQPGALCPSMMMIQSIVLIWV